MKLLSRFICVVSAALMLLLVVPILAGGVMARAGATICVAIVYFLVASIVSMLLHRLLPAADKHRTATVIWLIALVYFGLLVVVSSFMRYDPIFDIDAVYTGAINWGVRGNLTSVSTATFDASTYFYYFPNNLGSTGFLALFFHLCSLVGYTDYMFAGFILCSATCGLAFAGTALSAYELGIMYSGDPKAGRTAAVVAAMLYLTTPPLMFCAHMFYTDFLSMPFGILGAYFLFRAANKMRSHYPNRGRSYTKRGSVHGHARKYLQTPSPDSVKVVSERSSVNESEGPVMYAPQRNELNWIFSASANRSIMLLLAASALMTGIGIQIKATVGIVVIACSVCLVLERRWKLLLAYGSTALVSALAFMLLLNLCVYPSQLDRETAKQMNTPTLHWVMMGVGGKGWYSSDDYEFTRSFTDIGERDAAIKQRIGERLRGLGIGGFLELAGNKLSAVFGDGTASVGDFAEKPSAEMSLRKATVKRTIYDFINPSGRSYDAYKVLSNGARLCAMLLFASSAIILLLSLGKRGKPLCLVPLLCIVGFSVFLSFWEANDRYIVNMLPFLLLAAACGAERIGALVSKALRSVQGANPRSDAETALDGHNKYPKDSN